MLYGDFQELPPQSWVTPALMGTPWGIPVKAPIWTKEDKAATFRDTQLHGRVKRDGERRGGRGCGTILSSPAECCFCFWDRENWPHYFIIVTGHPTLNTGHPCCRSPWTKARETAHVRSSHFCSGPVVWGLMVGPLHVSLSSASSYGGSPRLFGSLSVHGPALLESVLPP